MAKNERRINAYFGRTVEEIELWEYLLENHPDDMAAYLKYYARLGIMQVNGDTGYRTLQSPTKPLKKRARKKNQSVDNAPITNKDDVPQVITTSARSDEIIAEDPLDDLVLDIQEIDSSQKLEQGLSRFIPEEDDEEVLEYLKNQIATDAKKDESK